MLHGGVSELDPGLASRNTRYRRCARGIASGKAPYRFESPVDELMTMQGVYRKWVGTPPPGLEASATVDALRAICELDLSRAIIPATIRETRSHPGGAASMSDRVCVFQT